ncbi:MAG: acyloxyacyl hydrolase [Proteobacteria bacterium]|nr:acyloxyacyl hydrolase [Pseudomonadota bacterium]MBU4296427.1 acyloxyacyl hydrolase [Pseudomonadota bacterium]
MNHVQSACYNNLGTRVASGFYLLLLLIVFMVFRADSAEAAVFDTSKDNWGFLGGYGQSFPGWGQTTQRVETIDLAPRYNHVIFADLGSGWYRGFHSILLELPVHLVISPDTSAMVGMNFLACYTFTASKEMRPYLFGGGGPVYSFADIPGMGAELNGNYQFGIGLEYKRADNHNLLFEIRYHHISNAGTEEPNEPLNSCKVLIGITF